MPTGRPAAPHRAAVVPSTRALIGVLAVVFAGKGLAALQAAGWINAQPVDFIDLPVLGIYPTLQTLLGQGLVLMVLLAGILYNHRSPSAAPSH